MMKVGDLVLYDMMGSFESICTYVGLITHMYTDEEMCRIIGTVNLHRWKDETMFDVLINSKEYVVSSGMLRALS